MKYELDQLIYYMQDNKVHSAKVVARTAVENLKHWDDLNTENMSFYAPWGKPGVWYKTCHGIINEEDAFASKEELLASL